MREQQLPPSHYSIAPHQNLKGGSISSGPRGQQQFVTRSARAHPKNRAENSQNFQILVSLPYKKPPLYTSPFSSPFVFMNIAGCTFIFSEAGYGTWDTGPGASGGEMDSAHRHPLRRKRDDQWQFPGEILSVYPLGILPFLCFHEHRRMHLHF